MFYPLPRDSIVQSHANDVSPSRRRLLQIPNAERRHHLNFRRPVMQNTNPDRGEKNVHGVQIIPCNARSAPSAPSAAQVGTRAAAASPAEQTLLLHRAAAAEGGRRREEEEEGGRRREEENLSRSVCEGEKEVQ